LYRQGFFLNGGTPFLLVRRKGFSSPQKMGIFRGPRMSPLDPPSQKKNYRVIPPHTQWCLAPHGVRGTAPNRTRAPLAMMAAFSVSFSTKWSRRGSASGTRLLTPRPSMRTGCRRLPAFSLSFQGFAWEREIVTGLIVCGRMAGQQIL
jgi:hypothetical protein